VGTSWALVLLPLLYSWHVHRNIYIQTQRAWFILGKPSRHYEEYFIPFWTQVYIFHLAIAAAMRDIWITYNEFIDNLDRLSFPRKNPVISPEILLGRRLIQADIEADGVVRPCFPLSITCPNSSRIESIYGGVHLVTLRGL